LCYQIRRPLSALPPGAHAAAGTPVGTVAKSGHKPALSHHARPLRCRHGPRATSRESRATSDQLGAPSFELRGCSPASEKRRRPTARESLLLSWLLGCASDADAGAGRRWQTLAGNSPPSHARWVQILLPRWLAAGQVLGIPVPHVPIRRVGMARRGRTPGQAPSREDTRLRVARNGLLMVPFVPGAPASLSAASTVPSRGAAESAGACCRLGTGQLRITGRITQAAAACMAPFDYSALMLTSETQQARGAGFGPRGHTTTRRANMLAHWPCARRLESSILWPAEPPHGRCCLRTHGPAAVAPQMPLFARPTAILPTTFHTGHLAGPTSLTR
jgi:hypothetical protein